MEYKRYYGYKCNTILHYITIVVTLRKGGLYSPGGYVSGGFKEGEF